MADILQEIIASKRMEVARQKQLLPGKELDRMLESAALRTTVSLKESLVNSSSGIIAEFKRRSPSKGWIFREAEVAKVLPAYEKAGAAGCSVLTDNAYFGGSTDDLTEARQLVDLPLLRKEFIVDKYQVAEARVAGADAILLIAAVLTPAETLDLAAFATSLHLDVLLEIHSEPELEYINPHVSLLGINNRNLGTFETSLEHSFRLSEKFLSLTSNALLVSESGISRPETVRELRALGFRGFLIGETFMKDGRPGETLAEFIRQTSDDH